MAVNGHASAIAICIQEPTEEGSQMDFGAIKGEELQFLHQAFIADTITNALSVTGTDIRLYHLDSDEHHKLCHITIDYLKKKLTGALAHALQERFTVHAMPPQRWGLRIETVFKECFEQDYHHVLLIGSRTPTITPKMLKTALKMLNESDAVFGPTPEGRYYVIGLSGGYKIPLSEMDWSSSTVYHDVADEFTKRGLTWSELEIWYSVETPDELELLARDINQYRFEGDEQTARETEIVMERIIARL